MMRKCFIIMIICVIMIVIFNANTTYCLNMIDGMTEKFVNIFTKGLGVVFEPIDQVAIEDSKNIEANVINIGNKNISIGNVNLPQITSTQVESMSEALKSMAKWYVNHVFTYQGSKAYEDFAIVDRVNGTIGHTMYQLGTGEDKRVEFLKDSSGTDIVFGGNYSYIGQQTGSDTEIIKKENSIKNTYYFKRMTDDLTEFIYDCICYIKASKEACENNHPYRKGSSLNYYKDCDLLRREVGDDCTRFAFAVLEYATGKKAEELGDYNDNSKQFVTDATRGGTIENLGQYFDIYQGDKLITLFKEEGLMAGDMLVGAQTDGNSYNHSEFIYENGTASKKQYRVFGWGSVKNNDVSYANFSIDGNYLKDLNNSGYKYSILYRRKGE